MKALCTICSKEKNPNPNLLPAVKRYDSSRIRWCHEIALAENLPLFILSGKFGLLGASDLVPDYDQLLTEDDLGDFVPELTGQLRSRGVTEIVFWARPRHKKNWAPYWDALERACLEAGVHLETREWPPLHRTALRASEVAGILADETRAPLTDEQIEQRLQETFKKKWS